MTTEQPGSSSSPSSRWLRFGGIGAGVVAVVALTSWCAAAVLDNDDGAPSGPDGAQTATPTTSPTATTTIASTPSPTGTPLTAASPTVATATAAPQTPTRGATATAPPLATATPRPPTATAPAQPTATPTTAPPTPTPTPTSVPPTPATLPNRTATYNFSLNAFDSTLTLNFNFAAGTVTGTLSGTRTGLLENKCYSGDQLLDTAEATRTDAFSSTLSATIAPTGGPFSSPADITGTTTYAITRPFTHPSCLSQNQVPAPVPFGGFGSVSGVVPADGPISLSVNTTVGNHSQ